MRTTVLTILVAALLAVPCALPVQGRQDLSSPRTMPTAAELPAGKPATTKEMLTQRLKQLRDEKQGSPTAARHSQAVRPLSQLETRSIPAINSSDIQQAGFEVSDERSLIAPSGTVESEIPPSAAPLFLDLTQDEVSNADSNKQTSADTMNADVTLISSPLQVLMRAVAWIVIALCLGSLTFLGLRRWQRQRGLLPTSNATCKVLETLSLGPGRTVSLIEIAGFRALVASDAGGIRSLVLTPSNFQEELLVAGSESEMEYTNVKLAAAA